MNMLGPDNEDKNKFKVGGPGLPFSTGSNTHTHANTLTTFK